MNAYAQDDPFAPLGADEFRNVRTREMPPDDWQPLPVPDDAPEAPTHHPKLGAWSHCWSYRNAGGSLSGYVCRFDTLAGKEMRPLRCGRGADVRAGTGKGGPTTMPDRSMVWPN